MGCLKELKGVDFVFEPHIVTEKDRRIMTQIIADYKATGKIARAPLPKRKASPSVKKAKNK